MRTRDMKALKVGDKVKLKVGSIEEMGHVGIDEYDVMSAIEKDPVVEVTGVFDEDQTIKIYHEYLGTYWFTKSWLEVYKPEVASKPEVPKQHPLHEVLTWVAKGEKVQFRNPRGGSRWQVLDTNDNFSFFSDFEYRLYVEEAPKFRWVFINDDGVPEVSESYTEAEANALFGDEKQKITLTA